MNSGLLGLMYALKQNSQSVERGVCGAVNLVVIWSFIRSLVVLIVWILICFVSLLFGCAFDGEREMLLLGISRCW